MDETTAPTDIAERIRELQTVLTRAIDDGLDPDSYNVGWLEGAIHELERLLPPPR